MNVSDVHAAAIDAVPGNGTAGLVSAGLGQFVSGGKKNGRWCLTCQPARLWNAWNAECPKGHGPTVPEQDAPTEPFQVRQPYPIYVPDSAPLLWPPAEPGQGPVPR